jgi:hypothetical protein
MNTRIILEVIIMITLEQEDKNTKLGGPIQWPTAKVPQHIGEYFARRLWYLGFNLDGIESSAYGQILKELTSTG